MYATLPKKGQIPFGGGEVGNVRTIRMLRKAGYEVITMRQRKAHSDWGRIQVLASYPFRLLAGWCDVLFSMLFGSRKGIAHLSGFAGVTIMNEYVIMRIMQLLGYKVIYELRGGGAIYFWDNGSSSYKRMFSYLLKNACYIFVQGKENIPLIESICKTPVYHYANCVEDGFAPTELPSMPTDKINLLFYGRCEEHKHVDMIVEADAPVRLFDAFVDRLKMDELGFIRSTPAETGTPGYNPRDLLKLYIYGYFYQVRSSRKLTRECKVSIR